MRRHRRNTTRKKWLPQRQIFIPNPLFKIHHHTFCVLECYCLRDSVLLHLSHLRAEFFQPEAERRIYNHGVFYTKFLDKGEFYIKESYLKPYAKRDTLHQPMEVTLLERIAFSCLSRLRGINPDFSWCFYVGIWFYACICVLYHS